MTAGGGCLVGRTRAIWRRQGSPSHSRVVYKFYFTISALFSVTRDGRQRPLVQAGTRDGRTGTLGTLVVVQVRIVGVGILASLKETSNIMLYVFCSVSKRALRPCASGGQTRVVSCVMRHTANVVHSNSARGRSDRGPSGEEVRAASCDAEKYHTSAVIGLRCTVLTVLKQQTAADMYRRQLSSTFRSRSLETPWTVYAQPRHEPTCAYSYAC